MATASLTARLAALGHTATPGPDGRPWFAPASAEAAAELLGTCTREGWRVRVQGAGSRNGASPDADLVVSARSLAGFDIYEPEDLTAGFLAGTTCNAAARGLAGHRQLLPLDLPGNPAGTLGGSFATGEAGPLRAGYGAPRDLALGLTLVTADGRVLHLGGQVVKNVAGYDLVRLVVGSRGTLGLITQLHVRLRSLPPSDLTLVATAPGALAGADLALRLRDAVEPVALELLAPGPDAAAWQVALRLHGSPAVTAAAAAAVQRLAPAVRTLEAEDALPFWAALARAEAAAAACVRCTGLPSTAGALLDAAATVLNSRSDSGLPMWTGAAHMTEGLVRIWPAGALPADAGAAGARLAELGAVVASHNGTCRCDRGPGAWRGLLPGPAPAPRLLELERELRRRFDPGSVLVGD